MPLVSCSPSFHLQALTLCRSAYHNMNEVGSSLSTAETSRIFERIWPSGIGSRCILDRVLFVNKRLILRTDSVGESVISHFILEKASSRLAQVRTVGILEDSVATCPTGKARGVSAPSGGELTGSSWNYDWASGHSVRVDHVPVGLTLVVNHTPGGRGDSQSLLKNFGGCAPFLLASLFFVPNAGRRIFVQGKTLVFNSVSTQQHVYWFLYFLRWGHLSYLKGGSFVTHFTAGTVAIAPLDLPRYVPLDHLSLNSRFHSVRVRRLSVMPECLLLTTPRFDVGTACRYNILALS
ncbi:hypothetical protein BDZ89DRAFT_1043379 [Hymenopellis radicata]|nr:hypothetical protein BDZ89DRAFT_1043379 [Hymenopellis radicata]